MNELPVQKYIKVWIEKRKNRKSTSYTLEWLEFGQRRFMSLGKHATRAFAKEAARRKEAELNNPTRLAALEPLTWTAFRKKYLDTFYPGHDLPTAQRKEKEKTWSKSYGTLKKERNAMDSFERLLKLGFCHEISNRPLSSWGSPGKPCA